MKENDRNEMLALIVGNGEEVGQDIIKNLNIDYIICADGGLEKAKKHGVIPDIIIGDFDSLDNSLLKEYENKIPIKRFPPEKDYTDMELAIEFALSRGYRNMVLIGAIGTRLDHTMANIFLMEKYYKKGVNITIVDNHNELKIISQGENLDIDYKKGYYVSIIPITACIEGLNMEGFKYTLNDVKVQRGSTLCISNQVKANKGIIYIKKGKAIVFISKD